MAQDIEALGRQSLGLYSDVTGSTQVSDMVSQTLDRFGRIDILVNNAGSRAGRDRLPMVDLEEETFDEVQRVNVKATYVCSKVVARHMMACGGGSKIIRFPSIALPEI